MVVTATELKANIGHYLNAVSEDDVFITKNGKLIAKLSSPSQDKQTLLDSLVGVTAFTGELLAQGMILKTGQLFDGR